MYSNVNSVKCLYETHTFVYIMTSLESMSYYIAQGAQAEWISLACALGYESIVKYLISVDSGIDFQYNLGFVALRGNETLAKMFVEHGVIPGSNALINAAQFDNENIMRYFASIGVDVHMNDDGALKRAASVGSENVVKYLVSIGGDKDKALLCAVDNNHESIARYLVSQGPTSILSRTSH